MATQPVITQWRLGGFKSVGKPIQLALAPLTFLSGPNSSGKSTILHSMLLMSQSVGSRYSRSPLLLNGSRIQLGTFRDLSHKSEAREVMIGLSFVVPTQTGEEFSDEEIVLTIDSAEELRASFDITASAAPQKSSESGTSNRLDELVLDAVGRDGSSARMRVHRRGGGRKPPVVFPQLPGASYLTNSEYSITMEGRVFDYSRATEPDYPPAAVALQGVVPTSVSRPYNVVAREVGRVLQRMLLRAPSAYLRQGAGQLSADSPVGRYVLMFFGQPAVEGLLGGVPRTTADIPQLLQRAPADKRRGAAVLILDFLDRVVRAEHESDVAFEGVPLPDWLATAANSLTATLAGIRHIGPLREPPRALFDLSTSADAQDVGSRGQFTAAVLHRFSETPIEHSVDGERRTEPLGTAVNYWMTRLGVHEGASTHERRFGHMLGIRDSALNEELDLTQVGVGVSQLLPIVVQGLLTTVGGVLLLEQPELHLHAAVQSRLTDFLFACSRVGVQIVCETHSEYMINRLRILVGEGHASVHDDFAVYFATRENGETRFDDIEFDEQGRIRNWPRGFFDQSSEDAARMLLLQAPRKPRIAERSD